MDTSISNPNPNPRTRNIEFNDCYLCPESLCFYHVTYPDKDINPNHPRDSDKIIKKRMTGLTSVLKNTFWPDYKLSAPKKRLYQEDKVRKKKYKGKMGSLSSRNHELILGKQLGPQARGSIVHDQIHMLSDPELRDKYLHKHGKVKDCYTEMALYWMKTNGWKAVANELAIADPDTGIATAIDAILYNEEKDKYIMVEWKTGDHDYFYFSTNGNCRLIKDLSNSLYNQSRIQAIMTWLILEKNYKTDFTISEVVVVHLGENRVHENIISKEFMTMAKDIYKVIYFDRKNRNNSRNRKGNSNNNNSNSFSNVKKVKVY